MQVPLQVSFDGIEPSTAVEANIREHAGRLEQFYPRLTSCRVVVVAPHQHHRKGRLYSIRIDLTCPGEEIVINREHPVDHAHEDVYVALRDAFGAARRKLEDYARLQRGKVKRHAPPDHGAISRLLPEEGYGFIRTADGSEIYFQRHGVLEGGFEALKEGMKVRFVLEEAEKGPNAKSVRPVGRHHQLELASDTGRL